MSGAGTGGSMPFVFRMLALFVVLTFADGAATGKSVSRSAQRKHFASAASRKHAKPKKSKSAASRKNVKPKKAMQAPKPAGAAAKKLGKAAKTAAQAGSKTAASQLQVQARRNAARQPVAKWPSAAPSPATAVLSRAPNESAARSGAAPPASSDGSHKSAGPVAKWSDSPEHAGSAPNSVNGKAHPETGSRHKDKGTIEVHTAEDGSSFKAKQALMRRVM
mmetsp:Transcript_110543/g.195770  ORF Transcript_110543/g.195770 Transcript_110543/m.195770 type:complete len:220 (+) Transcript_110543:86-745(+)